MCTTTPSVTPRKFIIKERLVRSGLLGRDTTQDRMKTLLLPLLMALALMSTTAQKARSQFTRYRSWNSRMYPVWKEGDPRFRNCWSGGPVTFDLKNDAPTLLGAKSTFNINLNFPPNQTVLADGQVVWARNCTIDGQQYQAGQAVYPEQTNEMTGVFPDGTPFTRTRDRKPHYVYVWKTWGKYWQVADGPSSSLTISTDDVSLGSYNMEVVIYHCRGKNKFIPLGYASTVFTITDQVPFTVSLAQVNDINQDDSNFIQKHAIAFSVNVHDPSQYLSSADITFSWDFGDSTGTLISRERTVTHTYLAVGTFKPQVVLMASIPNGCVNPSAGVPVASAVPVVVVTPEADPAVVAEADLPAADTDPAAAAEEPVPDATPVENPDQPAETAADTDDAEAAIDAGADEVEAVSAAPAAVDAAVAPAVQDSVATAAPAAEVEVAAEDAAAGEVATAAPLEPAAQDAAVVETAAADEVTNEAAETVPVVEVAASVAPVEEGEEAPENVAATVLPGAVVPEVTVVAEEVAVVEATAEDAAEVVQTETAAPADNVVVPAATESATVEEADNDNDVAVATAAPAGDETVLNEGEVQAEVEADPAQVALVVVKRQVPEVSADCMVYRYGSLVTSVDVVQGIDSVEIVQMSNVVSLATELNQNAVDVTVSCQGSLPSEVCTVISDAECIIPVETVCSVATPSPDCQMVLRQFFNESGVFCLNVSLTNDVSLAMTSARVSVAVASAGSPAGTAAIILGVLVLACVVCCIGLMYRRFKQYQPMREDSDGSSSAVTSVPLLLWNLLMRQSPGESRPLLQGRIV
ncbi:premelanosome protein a [Syngnathoides biaculeatus]|uniref:premelanosome protein a n=1 Tax=Syngnathoides biaculeatus TaxID=300417 RepID=UPI002ADE7FBA|nr:premelanosome protein a [Syngnathoides biaculeatus]